MPSLPEQVQRAFVARHKTLALAESCTGGLLASLLTTPPGASAYFVGSVVTYSNDAKTRLLGVEVSLRSVSPEIAKQMAQSVRQKLGADVGIAITGYAGPTGADVGLVYIGLASSTRVEAHEWRFAPPRDNVRRQAADEAMKLALAAVERSG